MVLRRSDKWYVEVPDAVRKSVDGKVEVWWNKKVITPNTQNRLSPTYIEANRPDVVIIDRNCGKWWMVDFSVFCAV